jgi:hypothetical protein
MNQKIKRQWLLGIVTALVLLGVGAVARASDDVSVRWDIIHVVLPVLSAGGFASASANDGSVITMTGSGRFQVADGSFDDATGGGTWQISDASNNLISSGTYRVRGVVLFTQAPGSFPSPPLMDQIGSAANAHGGLAVLRIAYSDGSRGILVMNCVPPVGGPPTIFEGITATKGFVNFATHGVAVDTVDANHTIFHVQAAGE